jgi:hypothetical protein
MLDYANRYGKTLSQMLDKAVKVTVTNVRLDYKILLQLVTNVRLGFYFVKNHKSTNNLTTTETAKNIGTVESFKFHNF